MDERELQERLHRAVGDARPERDRLWEDIMDASTRAHRARTTRRMGAGLAIAALAIAIPVAIQLAATDPDPNFAEPGIDPTPTTMPAGDQRYVDAARNVSFDVPEGWRVGEFEAHITAHPSGLPGPVEGGDTAFVEIFTDDVREDRSGEPNDELAGYPAFRSDTDNGGGRRTTWTITEWPQSTLLAEDPREVVPTGPLTVILEASTAALLTEHEATLEQIVGSLALPFHSDGRAGFLTRRGQVQRDVALTPLTLAAIDFLDRRLFADDPAVYLTQEALDAYVAAPLPSGDPRLDGNEFGYFTRYDLTMASGDLDQIEVSVTLTYVQDGGEMLFLAETFTVSPGTTARGLNPRGVVSNPSFMTGTSAAVSTPSSAPSQSG